MSESRQPFFSRLPSLFRGEINSKELPPGVSLITGCYYLYCDSLRGCIPQPSHACARRRTHTTKVSRDRQAHTGETRNLGWQPGPYFGRHYPHTSAGQLAHHLQAERDVLGRSCPWKEARDQFPPQPGVLPAEKRAAGPTGGVPQRAGGSRIVSGFFQTL